MLSIREVHSEDELENSLERVTGFAATPPEASGLRRAMKGGRNFVEGKFWRSQSSSESGNLISAYWPKTLLDDQTRKWESFLKREEAAEDRAVLYVQMQLCEKTLRCWLDERQPKDLSHFKNTQIFRQILCGVQYIHSQNIIHRDLKPGNVFVSSKGVVQIGDFGLAKQDLFGEPISPESPFDLDNNPWVKEGTGDGAKLVKSRSHHTSGVGTQAYASPEQLHDGFIDFKVRKVG